MADESGQQNQNEKVEANNSHIKQNNKSSKKYCPPKAEITKLRQKPSLHHNLTKVESHDSHTKKTKHPNSSTTHVLAQQSHTEIIEKSKVSSLQIVEGHGLCPECQKDSPTVVEEYSSGTQCGWCAAMFVVGCWPFCILPFYMSTCHKKVYRCQKCHRVKRRVEPACFPCFQEKE